MAFLRMPYDKGSAKEIMGKFNGMAYSHVNKEVFQEAVNILYGKEFEVILDLSKRMQFSCKVCNRNMNSEQAMKEHFNSGTHQKNLDKKSREGGVKTFRARSSNYASDSIHFKLLNSPLDPVGLQMIEEYINNRGNCYYKCILCGAHGRLDAIYQHIIGKKHTEKYIRSSCVLEESILTSNELQTLRQKLIDEEGVNVDAIKTIKGDDYYPFKWEREGVMSLQFRIYKVKSEIKEEKSDSDGMKIKKESGMEMHKIKKRSSSSPSPGPSRRWSKSDDPCRNLGNDSRESSHSPLRSQYSRSPSRRWHSRSPSPGFRSQSPSRRRHNQSPFFRQYSRSPLGRRDSQSSSGRHDSHSPPRRQDSHSPPRRRKSRSPLRWEYSRSPSPRWRSQSPSRRRRNRSPFCRQNSCSPKGKQGSHSPSGRGDSHSPHRRGDSHSPHRRGDSHSPHRTRDSRSSSRKRESHYPSTKSGKNFTLVESENYSPSPSKELCGQLTCASDSPALESELPLLRVRDFSDLSAYRNRSPPPPPVQIKSEPASPPFRIKEEPPSPTGFQETIQLPVANVKIEKSDATVQTSLFLDMEMMHLNSYIKEKRDKKLKLEEVRPAINTMNTYANVLRNITMKTITDGTVKSPEMMLMLKHQKEKIEKVIGYITKWYLPTYENELASKVG